MTADTHYGDAATEKRGRRRIELVAPAPPVLAKKGFVSNDCLRHRPGDGHRQLSRRPGGHHTYNQGRPPPGPLRRLDLAGLPTSVPVHQASRWPHHDVNPDEALLAPARKARWTEGFRQRYRQRAQADGKNAQLKYRQPKLPRPGRAKADAWLKLRMAALNLDHLGKTSGLIC
jgi:hypothetical protein